MFDNAQVQSYNNIKAPKELRQRVLAACEKSEPAPRFSWSKTMYGLAPIAVCLLLFFSVLSMNQKEPLLLSLENVPVTTESMTLPAMNGNHARLRPASLEPATYTVNLSVHQMVEILSAPGSATLTEEGCLLWTVEVPMEDTVFELFLQAEDGTYYIPLQYHVNDGSFTIRCEKE